MGELSDSEKQKEAQSQVRALLISGVVLFYFAVFSNYTDRLLTPSFQQKIGESRSLQHFIGIIGIFSVLEFLGNNQQQKFIVYNAGLALGVYWFFVLVNKQDWPLTIASLLLLLGAFAAHNQEVYLIEQRDGWIPLESPDKDEQSYKKDIRRMQDLQNILLACTAGLTLIGVMVYSYRQYRDHPPRDTGFFSRVAWVLRFIWYGQQAK